MAAPTIRPMELTLGDREVRPLTADDAMRMVEAGILDEDERVELLHGVLTRMSANHPPHAGTIMWLTRWLVPVIACGTHDVRVQMPFTVPDRTSLPEPDLAVVERDGEDMRSHPSSAALIVEVSVSSLRIDTKVKPPLYAAAGVPEYWVVDVPRRRLLVFTEPGGAGYATTATLAAPATAAPRHVDAPPLDLGQLFAGL